MKKPVQPFHGKTLVRFELLQETLVPRSIAFTQEERERSRALVNGLLSSQPVTIVAKIRLFMILIEVFSLITQTKAFDRLAQEDKKKVLQAFFESPVPLLRKGFWGLNTLARLGVYGQASLHQELGYHLRSLSKVEIKE